MAISLINNRITWYALDYKGVKLKEDAQQEAVVDDRATYYIKYDHHKYCIYDRNFERTPLKYGNVTGCHCQLSDPGYYNSGKPVKILFWMDDNSKRRTNQPFGYGIDSFKECLNFMEKLSKYPSRPVMRVYEERDRLKLENAALKAELKKLKGL